MVVDNGRKRRLVTIVELSEVESQVADEMDPAVNYSPDGSVEQHAIVVSDVDVLFLRSSDIQCARLHRLDAIVKVKYYSHFLLTVRL